jgi:sulfite oxidase
MRALKVPIAAASSLIVISSSRFSYSNNENGIAPGSPEGKPTYRLEEVKKHTSYETGIWVVYKDGVYDITKFIPSHPGGRDKIVLAAGKSVEPFWRIYQQHYNSALARNTLAPLRIGTLHPEDVSNEEKVRDNSDPYREDPVTSPVLIIHSEKPINAEPPPGLLADSWITPNDMFFVRNHHPVPMLDDKTFKLKLILSPESDGATRSVPQLSLAEIKSKFR